MTLGGVDPGGFALPVVLMVPAVLGRPFVVPTKSTVPVLPEITTLVEPVLVAVVALGSPLPPRRTVLSR